VIHETPVQLGGEVPRLTCVINNQGGQPIVFKTFAVFGRNHEGACGVVYCDLLDLARGIKDLQKGLNDALQQAPPELVAQVKQVWEEEGN